MFYTTVCIDELQKSPSTSPTSQCCSVPGWTVANIYDCDIYSDNSSWCEVYGDTDISEDGVSANEACCGKCVLLIP